MYVLRSSYFGALSALCCLIFILLTLTLCSHNVLSSVDTADHAAAADGASDTSTSTGTTGTVDAAGLTCAKSARRGTLAGFTGCVSGTLLLVTSYCMY